MLGRKRNNEGNFIGQPHKTPTLDTRIFTVRFPDGEEKDIAYNVLAEHLYSQVDADGNQYRLFGGLIGHRKRSSAVDKVDGYRMKNGKSIRKRTTTGWDIEVEWRDGSTSWLPLKEVKETNPVDLAQYGKDNHLIDEPAFAWWAPHILKKQSRLIKNTISRHKRRGYKFGIRIPTSVEEALELDKANGNTFWRDAIAKEMKGVRVAFDVKEKGSKIPPCETHDDIRCEARFH